MAFRASTRKELICLQKSDLCIYVVSNPGSTVRPSPCQRRTTPSRSAVVLASIAENGSSRSTSRASCKRSRAKSTRCICPPDSDPSDRDWNPVSPTAEIASATRARLPARRGPKAPISRQSPSQRNPRPTAGTNGRIPIAAEDRPCRDAQESRTKPAPRAAESCRLRPSAAWTCPHRWVPRRPSGCLR